MRGKSASARENGPHGHVTNISSFMERFGTEEGCEEWLLAHEWPAGLVCPVCGGHRCTRIAGRREYQCSRCRHQFSLTAGTAMAGTKLPLTKWFLTAFLVATDKRGVSAHRVAVECEVSDRCGLRLLRRTREAMARSECLQRAFG